MNLRALLPVLVPRAIAWARRQSEFILKTGFALSEQGVTLATRVGVAKPGLVRICYVPELPLPDDPVLREVAQRTGLIGPGMVGLTLGHGIFIVGTDMATHGLYPTNCGTCTNTSSTAG